MQIKTVRKIIEKKMKSWTDSITDEALRKQVKASLIVTGGCITSLLLNEDVNDFDVYISDKDVLKQLAIYYSKDYKTITVLDGDDPDENIKTLNEKYNGDITKGSKNILSVILDNMTPGRIKLCIINSRYDSLEIIKQKEDTQPYSPLCFSPNAITLTDKIQIVLRFHGDPEEIHKNYDYTHATNYYTTKNGLVLNQPALESILTRQLRYQGSLYPITSIIRMKKFLQRGWKITAGEILKILYQISKLDLNDFHVLEDQLIGVDVAYFSWLIRDLKNLKEPLTDSLLFNAIDKVFDYTPEEN